MQERCRFTDRALADEIELAESGASWWSGFGLSIKSELRITGANQMATPPANSADIDIKLGRVELPSKFLENGPYSRFGDSLLFHAAGVADYLAKDIHQLIVQPAPQADHNDVIDLMVSTALPMLLWMRGGVVLHAGCVVLPNASKAIALCGVSGVGKSALVDRLLAQGAKLLADDSLWLMAENNAHRAYGLSAGYHVRTPDPSARSFMPMLGERQIQSAELAAIIMLERDNAGAGAAPSKPSGIRALELLLKNRHRPRIPAIIGKEKEQFAQCVLHSSTIPIYEMHLKDGDITGAAKHITDLNAAL